MKCPFCGASGSKWEEDQFEIRGQIEGRPVRRCKACGTGFVFTRLLGRTRQIPDPIWEKMLAEWDRRMGAGFHEFERHVREARGKSGRSS